MNEFDIKINEYLEELPEQTRKVLVSTRWQNIANQIAKKYSLSETQTESMIREIWIVLIGGGDFEKFEELLQSEISISNLLAKELSEEIENRIFKVIIEKLTEKTDDQIDVVVNVLDKDSKDIPPDNLPTEYVEEEKLLNGKIDNYLQASKPVLETKKINEETEVKPEPEKSETIKQEPEIKKDIKPFDFNAKLNSTTSVSKEPINQNPVKNYSNDPYREPIE